MIRFLQHNTPVFFCVIIILILSQISPILALLVLGVWMLIWALQEENEFLVIMFALVLIIGDSRLPFFFPFKSMRYAAITVLFLKSVYDIARGKYKFNSLIYLSLPFFLVAMLGVAESPVKPIAFSKAISYFFLICICLNYLPYYFLQNKNRLLKHLLYLSILVLILGFLFLGISYNWAYLAGRYRGFFGNPNGLGIFAALIIPFGFIMLNKFPEKQRAAYVLIGLAFFSIILSNSRTSFGTTCMFFFLYFIYKGGKMRRLFFWFFLLPFIVFIFSAVPIEELVALVGLEEFLRVESLTTGTGRFLAWGMGLTEIQNNLLIGKGFGYEEVFFYERREILIATEHQGGMHNSYLTFLMNNGVLGVIPFIIFLLALFNKVKVKRFGFPFIIVSLISANFESWLNSSLNAFTFFFFMIIAFLVNYHKINPRI